MSPKQRGSAAELAVAAKLASMGYVVSIPIGDYAPYDLIVETPQKKIVRVQVRSTKWVKDTLTLKLRGFDGKTLDFSRIDWFALVDEFSNIYWVPSIRVGSLSVSFQIRRNCTKNQGNDCLFFVCPP